MEQTLCKETYGSESTRRYYVKTLTGELKIREDDGNNRWSSVSQTFRNVFLPQGYPDSVSDDYLQYQIWDTIQAFCSSITGTLALQGILRGLNLDDGVDSTLVAATITWLLKDGSGMVGRIVFAWLQGSSLDCDCKRWRLFADILNDFAIFLEISAGFVLFLQDHFRMVVCFAGVCKSIVGVAGGATRAALTQHQARRNNMADVSAKDGSQETLVNLAALICNLALVPLVTGNMGMIGFLFFLFTFLHLYANYSAVSCVAMETFNQARLHILMQHYLSTSNSEVLGVKETNRREPVLWKTQRTMNLELGVPLSSVAQKAEDLSIITNLYKDSRYLLYLDLYQKKTRIVLHQRSEPLDQFKACIQAEIIEYTMRGNNEHLPQSQWGYQLQKLSTLAESGHTKTLLEESYQLSQKILSQLIPALSHYGWSLNVIQLCADEWRLDYE